MIFCVLFKFITIAFVFFMVFHLNVYNLYFQAFIVGVFPIWSEVLIAKIWNLELAKATLKKILIWDAVADVITFIIFPSTWFLQINEWSVGVLFAIFIFNICGIYRVLRFLKKGLVGGVFEGLPVTYTGYIWVFLVFLHSISFEIFIALALTIVAYLMISRRIKIKPSR